MKKFSKQNNLNTYNNSFQIKNLVITSVLLSLAIIFSYITNFIKLSFLGDFLTLDISLIFIIPLIIITSFYWASFAGISLGLFSFLWSGIGGWVGVIFNIIVNVTLILIIHLIYNIFFKKSKWNPYLKWLIIMSITTILVSFLFSIFNGLLFTPLYWSLYFNTDLKNPSFIEAEHLYNLGRIPQAYLLFIPSYWGGVFGLYISFNLIKFSVISILSISIISFLLKANIIEKYFNKK